MAREFEVGQRVRVRDDAELNDGTEARRGRIGVVDHVAESGGLVFYCVAFGGQWDSGYIREEDLEATDRSG